MSCAALASTALAEDRTIELLSGSGGPQNVGFSGATGDGNRVFFASDENIPGTDDTDALLDIYQAQGGVITLLTGSNPPGSGGAIAQFGGASSDGTRVFFTTTESIPGTDDSDGLNDVYQSEAGVITLLSGDNILGSGGQDVLEFRGASSDGSRVFFETTENIPGSGDTDLLRDIHRAQGGVITLISGNNLSGAGGLDIGGFVGATSDGSRVFFETDENIPGSGDTDLLEDIHQAQGGVITLLSGSNLAVDGGMGLNGFDGVSNDGTRVFFDTNENIPLSGDTDDLPDTHQAMGGTITLLSGNNAAGDSASFVGASSNGTRVFFATNENIPLSGDTDGLTDIHQATGGVITLLTGNNPAGSPANFKGASSDGTRVFFESNEDIPTTGDTDLLTDIYRAQGGAITLLTGNNPAGSGGFGAFFENASNDGTRVFFESDEAIPGSGDAETLKDVFQATGGAITLLSGSNSGLGGQQVDFSGTSGDGSLVFFSTAEDIDSGDTDGAIDIYQSRLLPDVPGPGPGATPPLGSPATAQATGQRAAALKKCKKKKSRKARASCKRKAKKLPI